MIQECLGCRMTEAKGTDLFLNQPAQTASLHPTTTFFDLVDKPVTAGKT